MATRSGKFAFIAKTWSHYGAAKRAADALGSSENKRWIRNNNCIAVVTDVNAVSRGTQTSHTTISVKWLELAAEMNGERGGKCLAVRYETLLIGPVG